jgi:hypothetical protein
MLKRKSLTTAIVVPLLIGWVGLFHLMQQPRFSTYRTVDVVQLLGSGVCFGVAMVALMMLVRGSRNA